MSAGETSTDICRRGACGARPRAYERFFGFAFGASRSRIVDSTVSNLRSVPLRSAIWALRHFGSADDLRARSASRIASVTIRASFRTGMRRFYESALTVPLGANEAGRADEHEQDERAADDDEIRREALER